MQTQFESPVKAPKLVIFIVKLSYKYGKIGITVSVTKKL